MPPEHDGHEQYADRDACDARGEGDDPGARVGEDGALLDDALLVVLLGEPLSDAQRADPVFMAEHRAAAADVALLRARLGILGDALAEPPPPQPRRRPAGRRRPRPHPGVRALGLAGALAAAFAAAVFGIGWLASNSGSDAMSNGASSDRAAGSASGSGAKGQERTEGPGYLACARLVVEGTVTAVRQSPDAGEALVTLRVTRAYKPAKTAEEVRFPLAFGTDARIRAGVHLLVGVTRGERTPDRFAVGESEIAPERAWIVRDLPASRTLTCRG
ncbi:hypothetical protein ABZ619_15890 [Streptomyces sp. NPDC007851]|uniref:hypothetical protein n=1 Tax=Streptomyces sp. NPDC007851 TaxID=3155008 RepID=UPI00340E89A2